MHGAALAIAGSALASVDLLHHRHRVHALGDAVAVPAMGTGDAVAVMQVVQDADARGFLAGIQVDEAGNVAAREIHVQAFLELADRAHPAVDVQQHLLVER